MNPELTILSWPDYIHPQTLRQFEAESGVRVRVEAAASAQEIHARMKAEGRPADVLCPPDYLVQALRVEDLLLPLDHDRLPNLKHIDPNFQTGRTHDPESKFSVVKDWGTTGIVYRRDLLQGEVRSWDDFWRLAEVHSGRAVVLDSPGEVIGAALKLRGNAYNAEDAASLDQARRDLLALKPYLLGFHTDYRALLESGAACLALGWNGDAAALRNAGLPVAYTVPAEGSQIWEDDWAIAASTAAPETAHAWIDFVLRPAIAAQEARYTGYATANLAAFDLLDEATRSDPMVYPPPGVLDRLERGQALSAEGSRRREQLWQEIRSG